MNLDNHTSFHTLDPQGMLAAIDGLPAQLQTAWELGQNQPLPSGEGIRQVIIAGMGGSAIGADLLAAYAAPLCRVPVFVHRNYDLPAWAHGPQTLLIASSHSGNTEETLSAFRRGVENGCTLLAISTGGKLSALAQEHGAALWRFEHHGQPRAAVGYSFGLLLAAFARLGLLPDPAADLEEAVQVMRQQQAELKAEVPVVHNPAKRMAGQLYGRWVSIFGADILEPVARRWKGQISEVAKAWGQFEALPEANHNTLAGLLNPEEALMRTFALFLRAESCHPRNQKRINLTKQIMMLEGLNTDFVDARGQGRLAQQWSMLHFGDYTAYYLAIAYDVDPTPVEAIEGFKAQMR
ncbi:MAG: bifunctional phosphoglucose/phosphomannose isomerase [Anaerolineae bacterium]|nr:MAG: bifunctional phosphoglucose/phosphomannose isomerase [Anaerolineae bacterium]